jgi:DNA-binding NarL/FixJ family response regulator
MLADLVNVQHVSHSKLLLIHGEPAVNKVTGTLLQGTAAPRMAILVSSGSDLIMEMLRRDGYEASLVITSDQNVLEAVLAKQPDLLMLDTGVFEVLLQEVRNRIEEQTTLAEENTERLKELERQTDRDEDKIADLEKRNKELETALVRAHGTIQTITEIARRTLGSTVTKSPRAAGARGNLQREGDSQ